MKFGRVFSMAITVIALLSIFNACNFSEYRGYKKAKSGLYYKIYSDDNQDTTQVRQGSIITVNLKYGLKDSTLFDGTMAPQPIMLPVNESQYEGDFYECMRLLRQGDSASFVLKAGPMFTKTFGEPELPEFLKEDDDIYIEVKILKSQTQEEFERAREIENMQREHDEMNQLEEYVRANGITVQPTASGIYYLETKKGTGKSPKPDDYITAHYTVTILGGDRLFSTLDRNEPVDFKFGSQFENKGFMEVIGMMREGGKANAIIPSTMAFGAQGAGQIVPPFSTLYYDIEFIKVLTNEEFEAKRAKKQEQKKADEARLEQEENTNIKKYLADNQIVPTLTTTTGLIYLETQAGSGVKAAEGKKVKVHYTGKLLDGTKFDSSLDRGEPFSFTLGRNEVIDGWDEGIALMSQGGKATLIIPSKLAYKARGAGEVIPPYATLVFEVELIEVAE